MDAGTVAKPVIRAYRIPNPKRPRGSLLDDFCVYTGHLEPGGAVSWFSDLLIAFEGLPDVVFSVHKCIMAAAIPFFTNMGADILNSEETGDGQSVVTFDPAIVSPASFRIILSCIRGVAPPVGDEAALTRACEFLLMEKWGEEWADRFSSPAELWITWARSESPRLGGMELWWLRNLARQRETGDFCDLTIIIEQTGDALESFEVHKCIVANAFTNLDNLFPNLNEISEIRLSGDVVQPKMFERILQYVYHTSNQKIFDVDDLFHVMQACIFLGCSELAGECCWVLEKSSKEKRTETQLDDCFKLWRYVNHLKTSDHWEFPVKFCNAFITMLLTACKSVVFYDYTSCLTIQKLTFAEIQDFLSFFHANSLLQTHMLLIAAAWIRHAPGERAHRRVSLLARIEIVDSFDFDRLDRTELQRTGVMEPDIWKHAVKPASSSWRLTIIAKLPQPPGTPALDVKDRRLQHRFLAHLTGQITCIVENRKRVVGFEPSAGRVPFASPIFATSMVNHDPIRKIVLLAGRLFVICRWYGTKYAFWGCELKKDGKIGGRFLLHWPYRSRIVADQKYLYLVQLKSTIEKPGGCCGVFDLAALQLKKPNEVVQADHVFDMDISHTVSSSRAGAFKPKRYLQPVNGTPFLISPTHQYNKWGFLVTEYSVKFYDFVSKTWTNQPALPGPSNDSLQFAAVRGTIYAGFARGRSTDYRQIISILENRSKWEVYVLKPKSAAWETLESPNLVYTSPDTCSLFVAGRRLFVTGFERWGGPSVTKSYDMSTADGNSAVGSGWIVHPELQGYEHPKHFISFDPADILWTGSVNAPDHSGADGTSTSNCETVRKLPSPPQDAKVGTLSRHPPYPQMVLEAVKFLEEKDGSPLRSIVKYIRDNFDLHAHEGRIITSTKKALRKHVGKARLSMAEKQDVAYYKLPEPS